MSNRPLGHKLIKCSYHSKFKGLEKDLSPSGVIGKVYDYQGNKYKLVVVEDDLKVCEDCDLCVECRAYLDRCYLNKISSSTNKKKEYFPSCFDVDGNLNHFKKQ